MGYTEIAVSAGAFVSVAVAAVWPYLPKLPAPAPSVASSRSKWVNDLFVLVSEAEAKSQPEIAAAARALIAALVAQKVA